MSAKPAGCLITLRRHRTQDAETEVADNIDGFAGGVGDGTVELGLVHDCSSGFRKVVGKDKTA
jgi:hypothetical protein